MIGLTTQNEIEILKNTGHFSVFIQQEDQSKKWSIKIFVCIPGQKDQEYFIERQRGGIRLFAHLEDAIRMAMSKFGKVQNFVIEMENFKFKLEND